MISIHVRAWWWICHRAQFSSTEHKHGKCTPHWNKHTHVDSHAPLWRKKKGSMPTFVILQQVLSALNEDQRATSAW